MDEVDQRDLDFFRKKDASLREKTLRISIATIGAGIVIGLSSLISMPIFSYYVGNKYESRIEELDNNPRYTDSERQMRLMNKMSNTESAIHAGIMCGSAVGYWSMIAGFIPVGVYILGRKKEEKE